MAYARPHAIYSIVALPVHGDRLAVLQALGTQKNIRQVSCEAGSADSLKAHITRGQVQRLTININARDGTSPERSIWRYTAPVQSEYNMYYMYFIPTYYMYTTHILHVHRIRTCVNLHDNSEFWCT